MLHNIALTTFGKDVWNSNVGSIIAPISSIRLYDAAGLGVGAFVAFRLASKQYGIFLMEGKSCHASPVIFMK